MRYRLRTLLFVLALGPPLLAGSWLGWQHYLEYQKQHEYDGLIELIETTIVGQPVGWAVPTNTCNFGSTRHLVGEAHPTNYDYERHKKSLTTISSAPTAMNPSPQPPKVHAEPHDG
jgi:hypothetical protein